MQKIIYSVLMALFFTLNLSAQAKEWDLSNGANAVGYIDLPETVKVFEIDGETKSKFGQLFRRDTSIKLAEGKHQIKLRYEQFFDVHPSHEIHKSDPVELFFSVAAGEKYRLLAPLFDEHREGEKFAENPVFDIVDEKRNSILFTPSFEQKHAPHTLDTRDSVQSCSVESASNLDLLQQLWQQSTDEEREAFSRWINQ